MANIKSQIGDNPELLEKVIPKYPPFGNRILADNGAWLSTMKRDNVELITDGIREIVKDGIIDGNGNHHAVDIIVYATGFYTNKFLSPMEIIGKGGANLRDIWGDEARAYLGITVPKLSEPVPALWTVHQSGPRRQHHFPFRVPGQLRDGMHQGADRKQRRGDGMQGSAVPPLCR